MKITIELSEIEVKGLKAYLADVSGDIKPKITRNDIIAEVKGIISCSLQTGAVSDYIKY